MIEWNYKRLLIFYEISGNINDKMMMTKYVSIFNEYVLPLLKWGNDFILKENGNSGHNKANNNNMIRRWKQQYNLWYYFNAPQLPDLTFIENCWQLTKIFIKWENHLSDDILEQWIIELWRQLLQSFINKQVFIMHD